MIRRLPIAIALAVGGAACQERLTQPGECPALCPGGVPEVVQEILEAAPELDSTFTGYAERGAGAALLVSAGVPTAADTNIPVVVFTPRAATTTLRDTTWEYTIDSIRLGVGMIARDTAMRNVRFELYRLPATLDTTALDYAGVRALLTPAALVATIPVADTATRGAQTIVLRDAATLAPLALGPDDGGRLRLGIGIVADGPTGARLGSRGSVLPATFETFIRPNAPNTVNQELDAPVEFDTYVSSVNPVPGPDLLTVGGTPASRSLIRFTLPARLRDSASIIRATLELSPVEPVRGLPNDPGNLEVRVLTADLGAKSPTNPNVLSGKALAAGTAGTVEVEIGSLVRLWQGAFALPSALMLQVSPEAATFSEATFGSTRSGSVARIRLEYLRAFPFQTP
jgi:hypothetical protein